MKQQCLQQFLPRDALWHSYTRRIARSSLRELRFLV